LPFNRAGVVDGLLARGERSLAAPRFGEARRPLARIAPDAGHQLREVNEFVGLPPQLVGHHRRLGRDRRDDGDAHALALHRLDQRTEVAVAREQHHLVDMRRHLHRRDREFDIHVALDLPPSRGIDEFLGRFGHDGIAVVIEPVDQRAD
jgi:hypothetical protein